MNTLFQVLFTLIRALAPFIPFITEHIYGLLKPFLSDATLKEFADSRSIHFLPFPTVQESLFDEVIERQVDAMQKVIQLGRQVREQCNLTLKMPLLSMVVVADSHILADVGTLTTYVREELNVRDVILSSDEEQYNIILEARVDWPTLGKKLKKQVQVVRKALPSLTQAQLRQYLVDKKITVEGIELEEGDITMARVLKEATANDSEHGPKWQAIFAESMVVLLDTTPHPELAEEGLAREIINRVQRLRKKAGLIPSDDVVMQYKAVSNPDEVDFASLTTSQGPLFKASLRGQLEAYSDVDAKERLLVEEEQMVGDLTFMLRLLKM